jgi:hypothetical protein
LSKKKREIKKHETELIALKVVPIDVGMVSTVNWLNSFLSVHTLWSCEGDDPSDDPLRDQPYVSFFCWDVYDLQKITEKIQQYFPGAGLDFGIITVENYAGYLRYTIRFQTKEVFSRWKSKMGFK